MTTFQGSGACPVLNNNHVQAAKPYHHLQAQVQSLTNKIPSNYIQQHTNNWRNYYKPWAGQVKKGGFFSHFIAKQSHTPRSLQALPWFLLPSPNPTQHTNHSSQPVNQEKTASLSGPSMVMAGHVAQGTQFCPLENMAITSLITSGALSVCIYSSQAQSHWL